MHGQGKVSLPGTPVIACPAAGFRSRFESRDRSGSIRPHSRSHWQNARHDSSLSHFGGWSFRAAGI